MRCAVVIATYDEARWDDLDEAIRSVEKQDPPPAELIVAVDHNPALARRVAGAYPGVLVVENTGDRGASDNRNTASAAATAELLVFLDDDAVAGPDWLAPLCAAASRPDAVGAGGFLHPRWAVARPAWFPLEFGWVVGASYTGQPRTISTVRNVWSGSMAVRTDAFRAVGGFRSGFGKTGGRSRPEDTDLCIRVSTEHPGRNWYFEPQSQAEHKVPAARSSWSYFCARSYAEGRGKVALGSYVGGRTLLHEGAFGAFTIPAGIGRELRNSLRGDLTGLLRVVALVAGLLLGVAGAAVELASGARSGAGRPAAPARAGGGTRSAAEESA